MVKIILVDDEHHCLAVLQNMLLAYPEIEVCATSQSVEEGHEKIIEYKPELVFLDVELQNRKGFELIEICRDIRFEIVLTTAYPKYAIEGFKYSALDYLLKPIARADLSRALEKYRKKKKMLDDLSQSNLKENHLPLPKKISIATRTGYSILTIKEIIKCEADSNYAHIYLNDKSRVTMAKPLKYLDLLLAGHGFCRIHQSYIVNLNFAKRYYNGRGEYLELLDGSKLKVSPSRKEELLKVLNIV